MCKKYNYQEDISCISQSLYYNFINETPTRRFDHLHIDSVNTKNKVSSLKLSSMPRHLSWVDEAFKEKRFRDMLDVIVGFNEKSDDTKQKPLSMVQKIRDGIRNGTIVKEYKPDGTYIWKKVRK